MGLKKDSYKIEKLNITIAPVYSMVGKIEIENDTAIAEMKIHKTREDLEKYEALETINITCNIKRNLSVYEQIYIKAKEDMFQGWEDDIIPEN